MDASCFRSTHGEKPRIIKEFEELRKVVRSLKTQVDDQQLELERTSKDVVVLQRELAKKGALAGSQTSDKKDQEPSIVASASVVLGPTAATLRRMLSIGRWVILHGQCWRKDPNGKPGLCLELVSDEEMEIAKGITWKDIRGLTDEELLQKHLIARGGGVSVLSGFTGATQLVSQSRMEEVKSKYVGTTLVKLAKVQKPKSLVANSEEANDEEEDKKYEESNAASDAANDAASDATSDAASDEEYDEASDEAGDAGGYEADEAASNEGDGEDGEDEKDDVKAALVRDAARIREEIRVKSNALAYARSLNRATGNGA